MREIKFRAWDEERATMIYPDNVLHHKDGDYLLSTVEEGKLCCFLIDNDELIRITDNLMQYTGLKDRDGVVSLIC